jgi:hypothetical protein
MHLKHKDVFLRSIGAGFIFACIIASGIAGMLSSHGSEVCSHLQTAFDTAVSAECYRYAKEAAKDDFLGRFFMTWPACILIVLYIHKLAEKN